MKSKKEAIEDIEMATEEDSGSDEGDQQPDSSKYTANMVYRNAANCQDEELICDENSYIMLHSAESGAPCLSFDVVLDGLGDRREDFPMTCYLVAGTQAERSHMNQVLMMRMSNLHRLKKAEESDDSDEESDEEDEEDKKPELEMAMIKHPGTVNRIRTTYAKDKQLAASWGESGKVHIWQLNDALEAVNSKAAGLTFSSQPSPGPLFTFAGHMTEGFSMDWSPLKPGCLATGDCNKNIFLWTPEEGGSWNIDQRPYSGHLASVEDIQWSPNEPSIFASCSVDQSLRIWDVRAAPNKANKLTVSAAHASDVNVISWNRHDPFIVSGGDDGLLRVWDLRQLANNEPVAEFKHHGLPITSVEWDPLDSSVFAASGADNQLTIWDLALERDTDGGNGEAEESDVPPQLLFVHQGQKDIKELHWHPQLPGVIISTALSGYNIFRTISV